MAFAFLFLQAEQDLCIMTTGNIYYFNPTCELAVANGSFSYQPPLLLKQMEDELALLPFVFCSENDFVITENKPPKKLIDALQKAGFDLPRFCSQTELEAMPDGTFNQLIPWGWSPAAHYKLSRLKEKCAPEFRESPVFNWHNAHRMLYERSTSLEFLRKILEVTANEPVIDRELTGIKAFSIAEIEALLLKYKQLVIKAPLSSSGRGIQMIRKTELDNARKQWISGVLKQQKYIIAEPFLEKIADFSFQFRIGSESDIEYLGLSFFETNSNGQYQRTLIRPDTQQNLNQRINQSMSALSQLIAEALKTSVYSRFHRGFIGIDAMIFSREGSLFIHPCVEVNCRMNMGILAKLLENRIRAESNGKFELFYGNAEQFETFVNHQSDQNRLTLRDGKILSGFLPLTNGNSNARFGAYLLVDAPK